MKLTLDSFDTITVIEYLFQDLEELKDYFVEKKSDEDFFTLVWKTDSVEMPTDEILNANLDAAKKFRVDNETMRITEEQTKAQARADLLAKLGISDEELSLLLS